MQADIPTEAPHKPARQQAPRHAFDRRSRAAKRYAALVEQFTAELGAGVALTEGVRSTVNQLAGVVLQSEAMVAAAIRGDTVDTSQQVRLANLQARLMRVLGIGTAPKPAEGPNLKSYLAGKAA